MFHNPHYLLGCPVWACPHWKGTVYQANAIRPTWLKHYSGCFNCVEGNSTFYGIPTPQTFRRWANETATGFKFCLKFPRSISHDCELVACDDQLKLFLEGLEILAKAERLGPTFLQMGPAFDARQFDILLAFLNRLPAEFAYAVEVRHADWFHGEVEQKLFEQLAKRNMDRVIFDSRPLFVSEPRDEYEVAARKRKPRVPIRTRATGTMPMLRLIGRNDVECKEVTEAIEAWSELVAIWIENGLSPIVFAHTPDDQFAPAFARRFHNRLAERLKESPRIALSQVDNWPFDQGPKQQSLF